MGLGARHPPIPIPKLQTRTPVVRSVIQRKGAIYLFPRSNLGGGSFSFFRHGPLGLSVLPLLAPTLVMIVNVAMFMMVVCIFCSLGWYFCNNHVP